MTGARFPIPCIDCGAKAIPGTNRCARHTEARPRICAKCRAHAIPGSQFCADHQPTEADRLAAQPWRGAYRTPEDRASRARRYLLVKGLCESCGAKLKGKLHPNGVPWECDHVVALSEGGTSDVPNRRCYCVPCHKVKTARDRRK